MNITGESENIPSWLADWPHCCNFQGGTCDGLRWPAMLLKASESQQNGTFHRIVWPSLRSQIKGAPREGLRSAMVSAVFLKL